MLYKTLVVLLYWEFLVCLDGYIYLSLCRILCELSIAYSYFGYQNLKSNAERSEKSNVEFSLHVVDLELAYSVLV